MACSQHRSQQPFLPTLLCLTLQWLSRSSDGGPSLTHLANILKRPYHRKLGPSIIPGTESPPQNQWIVFHHTPGTTSMPNSVLQDADCSGQHWYRLTWKKSTSAPSLPPTWLFSLPHSAAGLLIPSSSQTNVACFRAL